MTQNITGFTYTYILLHDVVKLPSGTMVKSREAPGLDPTPLTALTSIVYGVLARSDGIVTQFEPLLDVMFATATPPLSTRTAYQTTLSRPSNSGLAH